MSDTFSLIESLESSQDQFERYRVSVTPTIDDRDVGDLSRALHAILPDLAFHEGQAAAAGIALGQLTAGAELSVVCSELSIRLLEYQGARQSSDFLAGFAQKLAEVRRAMPR